MQAHLQEIGRLREDHASELRELRGHWEDETSRQGVKVIANDRAHVEEIPDKRGVHKIKIPSPYGYTGSAWGDIRVEVLEPYPDKNPNLAIAEFHAYATNYEGL